MQEEPIRKNVLLNEQAHCPEEKLVQEFMQKNQDLLFQWFEAIQNFESETKDLTYVDQLNFIHCIAGNLYVNYYNNTFKKFTEVRMSPSQFFENALNDLFNVCNAQYKHLAKHFMKEEGISED